MFKNCFAKCWITHLLKAYIYSVLFILIIYWTLYYTHASLTKTWLISEPTCFEIKGHTKLNMLFTVFRKNIKDEPTETGYLARFCKSEFVAFIILNSFFQCCWRPNAKHDGKDNGYDLKGRYTRGSWLLKHAPAKQISVHTRELAPETRSRKANFSTHEGACPWNRIVQQICPWSLLPHITPVWYDGAKLGSKSLIAQHTFSLQIVGGDEGALLRESVAGACCGSKLPRVYRP